MPQHATSCKESNYFCFLNNRLVFNSAESVTPVTSRITGNKVKQKPQLDIQASYFGLYLKQT